MRPSPVHDSHISTVQLSRRHAWHVYTEPCLDLHPSRGRQARVQHSQPCPPRQAPPPLSTPKGHVTNHASSAQTAHDHLAAASGSPSDPGCSRSGHTPWGRGECCSRHNHRHVHHSLERTRGSSPRKALVPCTRASAAPGLPPATHRGYRARSAAPAPHVTHARPIAKRCCAPRYPSERRCALRCRCAPHAPGVTPPHAPGGRHITCHRHRSSSAIASARCPVPFSTPVREHLSPLAPTPP